MSRVTSVTSTRQASMWLAAGPKLFISIYVLMIQVDN